MIEDQAKLRYLQEWARALIGANEGVATGNNEK